MFSFPFCCQATSVIYMHILYSFSVGSVSAVLLQLDDEICFRSILLTSLAVVNAHQNNLLHFWFTLLYYCLVKHEL